ncbi:uncharacterized protein LOC119105310 [Pollicipes pollicipes]|uniref:uncharacterized protein LOC119105310 n=1 Tax=Pollicipes pollicipes TaxID=41117 RepID=UPI00188511BA|nr:uncharacterized protein LOC119105310 [Pollicipes pollicipes]
MTVCARPRAAAAYYLLIGVENAVLLGLWVAFSSHIPHTKLATVTGAAATFSVGAVILVMLYCYSAEAALAAPADDVLAVHAGEKAQPCAADSYVDYKLEEEEEAAAERRRRVGNLYTAFPVLSRSDRSTDNHSANSRNTNTLCDAEATHAEPLVLHVSRARPRSPRSDTASSASRAVLAHCVTSTPKRAPWEKTPAWLQLCGPRTPPDGRPKKKLCRRQHADCPQAQGRAACGPLSPPAPRPRKQSRKQKLKGVLLRNKLCKDVITL